MVIKVTEEEKLKISLAQKGIKRGPKHTPEHKAYMSKIMTGRKLNSPEHYQKLADMKRGIPCTEETKAKISATKTGVAMSAENKLKISIANKGKPKSEEYCEKYLRGAASPLQRQDVNNEEIMRLYNSGMAKRAIARKLNVNQQMIQRRIKAYVRDLK